MKFFLYFMLLSLVVCASLATDGKTVYAQYRQIIDDQSKTSADRVKQGQMFLRALGQTDFLGFIRESKQVAGYDDKNEAILLAMATFAKSYMAGPGRNESLTDTLKQFSDPTLPIAWKTALLDVLNLENRADLSESEVAEVTNMLMDKAQNKQGSERFRFFCLQTLGSLLYSQRELIMEKAPQLKDALEKQDRSALPKSDDDNVKQAAKLIDAIRDYKAALKKTVDEVKDDQIKANLKKRLMKWEPASVTPAN